MLGIGIPEVLMNLVSYHGVTKKTNLYFILVYRSRFVNYYLAIGFIIIEHNYKHLISVSHKVEHIIHAIDKQKTYYVMACYIGIYSVENILNKLEILSNLHTSYKNNFYHDKRDNVDGFFDQYHLPLFSYIVHTTLIQ